MTACSCSYSDSKGWISRVDPNLGCYDVQHAPMAAAGILGAICLMIISTVWKMLIFDKQLMQPGRLLARQASIYELELHVIRTVLCVLIVAVPDVWRFIQDHPLC